MGVGEGDDMDGRQKGGKRDRSGRKKKERETGMGERKIEREIGRETGVGERERERERDRGLQTQKKSCNFILSYFTPQNGVKHDSGL